MRGFQPVAACVALTAVTAGCAIAQEREILLAPIADHLSRNNRPLIIDGQPADPGEYPASFQAATGPDRVCTWFLVGPKVLVSAAHCLGGPSAKVRIDMGDVVHTGSCQAAPGHATDASQDISLCQIAPAYEIPQAPEIPVSGYEVLNQDASRIALSMKVEISGFGCTEDNMKVSDTYLIGTMKVSGLPPDARIPDSATRTPNAIKLREAPSRLCGGDSGGPAFLYPKGGRIFRVVVGVNLATFPEIGASYLTSVSAAQVMKFVTDWKNGTGEQICGIDKDLRGCRPLPKEN
jgi:secreted trypsin-like serine protease